MNHRTSDRPEPYVDGGAGSLSRRIGQGDQGGFDGVVNRYKNRLLAYIAYRVSDRHRAEDLTQEVFLRAFRATARGKHPQPDRIAAWLFTIARNCVIEFLRRRGRKPLVLETDLAAGEQLSRGRLSPEPIDPAEAAEQADEWRRIQGLLASLPEDQREVLVLRVFGGLTLAEIAESTGSPLATVKSRMRYGLLKIRRMIEPSSGERA